MPNCFLHAAHSPLAGEPQPTPTICSSGFFALLPTLLLLLLLGVGSGLGGCSDGEDPGQTIAVDSTALVTARIQQGPPNFTFLADSVQLADSGGNDTSGLWSLQEDPPAQIEIRLPEGLNQASYDQFRSQIIFRYLDRIYSSNAWGGNATVVVERLQRTSAADSTQPDTTLVEGRFFGRVTNTRDSLDQLQLSDGAFRIVWPKPAANHSL